MFGELISKYRQKRAIKQWRSSPLGASLENHSRKYFFGDNAPLGYFSEEAKRDIVGGFYEKVLSLGTDEQSFLTFRKELTGCVLGYAPLKVISLKEDEKKAAFYSDCPYISGALYKSIRQISEHNDLLKECRRTDSNASDEDLVSMCSTRCAVLLYFINGYNLLRIEMKDVIEGNDWLRPFIKSMLIWEEHGVREKIGLPSLLPAYLDGLRHSLFFGIVLNGHKDPYSEWKKSWRETELEVE